LAAVPSIGRAVRVEGAPAPEADLTRALYEQYANQIFRYCLHQLGSREEAEDAVQSTFLNAFRGIKRGVVPELESAWLFKIAHNVCLSRRRTSWRRGRIESPTDFDVVEELTPAPSRRADELIGLQDVLEQMPENQRRAILLREWQGLSYREIAEELELSQAAVETLIFRARRALAAGLEQPPESKRRIVRGADIGNVLAGLKSLLLGGGAAVKVAATVAVVSASTVVAAAPVQQHRGHSPAAPRPSVRATAPVAPSSGTTSVAGPVSAFPVKTGAQVRPRLQLVAALAFAELAGTEIAGTQIAGTVTPEALTVVAPAEPAASEPGLAAPAASAPAASAPAASAPAPPASEPAAAQPADAPRVERQHGPATTQAPAEKTTSDKAVSGKSNGETSSGRSGEPRKDTTSGQGSAAQAGQGTPGGTSDSQSKSDKTDSQGKSDSKGSDSEQRTSSSAGGTATPPAATTPATPPAQAIQAATSLSTTSQVSSTAWSSSQSSGAPSAGPAGSSKDGNDSKGTDAKKRDPDKSGASSPPALSSGPASLPAAAPAGVQSGATPTSRGKDRPKGDNNDGGDH